MLLVNEIYPAICGESRLSGTPCTLVRLAGCHLRCSWCDSPHAFGGGRPMSPDAILAEVRSHGFALVLLTGGEPLLQAGAVELMTVLLEAGHPVLLETSGTLGHDKLVPLSAVPSGVSRVVDVKAPGSGIDPALIDWDGIAGLGSRDELKFVLADRRDFDWAAALVREPGRLPAGPVVSFSPVAGVLGPAVLAEWILAEKVDVRFQIQLHKVLWPGREGGV
ncbi:MAG: radical SAM protein [Candidatus Krumholzibacteriia bacterium]